MYPGCPCRVISIGYATVIAVWQTLFLKFTELLFGHAGEPLGIPATIAVWKIIDLDVFFMRKIEVITADVSPMSACMQTPFPFTAAKACPLRIAAEPAGIGSAGSIEPGIHFRIAEETFRIEFVVTCQSIAFSIFRRKTDNVEFSLINRPFFQQCGWNFFHDYGFFRFPVYRQIKETVMVFCSGGQCDAISVCPCRCERKYSCQQHGFLIFSGCRRKIVQSVKNRNFPSSQFRWTTNAVILFLVRQGSQTVFNGFHAICLRMGLQFDFDQLLIGGQFLTIAGQNRNFCGLKAYSEKRQHQYYWFHSYSLFYSG